jgi:RNA polymerase sigma factor (sigma-70 family)
MLTANEERDLATKWQQYRDKQARDTLILENISLVVSIAKDFRNFDVDWEDLKAEGTLALFRAADTFDASKSRFASYAIPWIRSRLFNYVTANAPIVSVNWRERKSYVAQRHQLEEEYQDSISEEPNPAELYEVKKENQALWDAIETLSPIEQEVIKRRYLFNSSHTQEEVAKQLKGSWTQQRIAQIEKDALVKLRTKVGANNE